MRTNISMMKLSKTIMVVAAANQLITASTADNPSLSFLLSLMTNLALVSYFHDRGQLNRIGSNMTAGLGVVALTLFGSKRDVNSIQINNACRNIVNGGADTFDQFADLIADGCHAIKTRIGF